MNFATLIPDSPFYELFPRGEVPIVNIVVPNQVTLEGSEEKEAFMVDLEKVGQVKLAEIARRLAANTGHNPDVILTEILDRGLPLRRSQVVDVSTDVPFFL